MRHEYVIELVGVCRDDNQPPWLVFPLYKGGSLRGYLIENDNLPQEVCLKFLYEIALGMQYITSLGIVHRDLATRNCLLDEQLKVKIADFGLSRELQDNAEYQPTRLVKLPIKWMAPEAIERLVFNEKTDVWAFGVTTWEVMTGGNTPFSDITDDELKDRLRDGHRLRIEYTWHKDIRLQMEMCWQLNSARRPTFSELCTNFDDVINGRRGEVKSDLFNGYKYTIDTIYVRP